MSPKTRVGIVGLGNVGQLHLEAYQKLLGQIEFVSAAEIDTKLLRQLACQYNFRPYEKYSEMLRTEKLDLVCVSTPAATHCEITLACASAGVNVLCEKPLAVDVESAQQMITSCRQADVRLFYGASYRFLPAIQKARQLIQSGVIGDVLILKEQVVGGVGPENHKPLGFSHYPKGGPGGSGMGLVDHGIHLIDAFSWLLDDDVVGVFGRGNISGDTPATEYVHLNFKNNAIGQLLYSDGTFATDLPPEGTFSWGRGWDAQGYTPAGRWVQNPACIHIHGTKGALRVFHYANSLYLFDQTGVGQVSLEDRPSPSHFATQLQTVLKNITDGQPAEVPGEVGLCALRDSTCGL